MKNASLLVLCFLLLTTACRRHGATEKEDVASWNAKLVAPAGDILYKSEKLPLALRFYDSLLAEQSRPSTYARAARYTVAANYHLFFTKNNDSTAAYIDSALSFYPTRELQEQYPRTYVGLLIFGGEINFRLGNYAKSNQYFFLAKQLADQYLDPCERSGFTYNAAMVSYRQENYLQAAAYFDEAYQSQAGCAIQTTAIALQQQEIQSNIGLCLIHLQQYDSAAVHFNRAMEIAEQFRDSLGASTLEKIRGVIAGHLGKVYAAKKEWDKAVPLYRESVALNSRPGFEQRHALQMEVDLAGVYGEQANYTAMNATLHAVRTRLDQLPDVEAELGWRRLMAEYFRATGQPLSELVYSKSYHALKDSIAENKKQLVQADISRQLKDKEQALRIADLTRKNEMNRIFIWVALLLSFMAGVIIFLVYQNYRRGKKNIKILTRLNQEINLQKTALEKANQEKDRILHVVAHDLRNPIGIVAYVSDLVMMEDRNEKDQSYLRMIKEASQQALTLTNELLDAYNTRAAQAPHEKIDLAELVKTGINLHRPRAAEKGQRILLEQKAEGLYVHGDPQKLNRVVSNLLANAIKFSPLDEAIFVSMEKEADGILLMVRDRGVGIPSDQQHTVFDRFTSARRKGTSGEKSFGLGLSICKDILESHGGTIRLDSKEGEGTRVEVRLRLADNGQFLS